MEQALKFICAHKIAQPYGLVWGATRADWGDVQPESPWGVVLDENSHKAICIYDNAMFLIAIQDYLEIAAPANEQTYWKNLHKSIGDNTRKYLWDTAHKKFIPYLYFAGSPFPASLDENQIYYHGGTTVAIQAGILGVRSRRVMVQVPPLNGSLHYGKSTSRQRPHDAAPSSRVPSVERKYPFPGRQARVEPEDSGQVAQAPPHDGCAHGAAPAAYGGVERG